MARAAKPSKKLMAALQRHAERRELIQLERAGLDERSIQGFVLAASEQLIVLQYVYDFLCDGLLALCTSDVSALRRSATDALQQGMLQEAGALAAVPFGQRFDVSDWPGLIGQWSQQWPLLVLECEAQQPPDFLIGQVLKVGRKKLRLRGFSGTARWWAPERWRYADITCCQVGTRYIQAYQRHFERHTPQVLLPSRPH